jgi:lipopolysaccharide export LptBFGC system permease protein LptF
VGPYARHLALRFLLVTALLSAAGVLLLSVSEAASGPGIEFEGSDAWIMIVHGALRSPALLGLVMPLATVLAGFVVLGLASLRQEVVAAYAVGCGPWRLLRWSGMAALGLSVLGVANSLWLAPTTSWEASRFLWGQDTDEDLEDVLRIGDDTRWHLSFWDGTRGTSCRLFTFQADGQTVRQWVRCEAVSYGAQGWTFERGTVCVLGAGQSRSARFVSWSQAAWTPRDGDSLPANAALPTVAPDSLLARRRIPDEWTWSDLRLRAGAGDAEGRRARAILNQRLGLSLAPLLVLLAVVPLGLRLEQRELAWRLGLVVALCWLMYLLVAAGRLATARGVPALLLPWAPLTALALWGALRTRRTGG